MVVHIKEIEAILMIRDHHPLGVRRPDGLIAITGAHLGHRFRRTGPVGCPQYQLILAGRV